MSRRFGKLALGFKPKTHPSPYGQFDPAPPAAETAQDTAPETAPEESAAPGPSQQPAANDPAPVPCEFCGKPRTVSVADSYQVADCGFYGNRKPAGATEVAEDEHAARCGFYGDSKKLGPDDGVQVTSCEFYGNSKPTTGTTEQQPAERRESSASNKVLTFLRRPFGDSTEHKDEQGAPDEDHRDTEPSPNPARRYSFKKVLAGWAEHKAEKEQPRGDPGQDEDPAPAEQQSKPLKVSFKKRFGDKKKADKSAQDDGTTTLIPTAPTRLRQRSRSLPELTTDQLAPEPRQRPATPPPAPTKRRAPLGLKLSFRAPMPSPPKESGHEAEPSPAESRPLLENDSVSVLPPPPPPPSRVSKTPASTAQHLPMEPPAPPLSPDSRPRRRDRAQAFIDAHKPGWAKQMEGRVREWERERSERRQERETRRHSAGKQNTQDTQEKMDS